VPQWYESGKIYAEAHPEVPQREHPYPRPPLNPNFHPSPTVILLTITREHHRTKLVVILTCSLRFG